MELAVSADALPPPPPPPLQPGGSSAGGPGGQGGLVRGAAGAMSLGRSPSQR
jgi:hypothetical protein